MSIKWNWVYCCVCVGVFCFNGILASNVIVAENIQEPGTAGTAGVWRTANSFAFSAGHCHFEHSKVGMNLTAHQIVYVHINNLMKYNVGKWRPYNSTVVWRMIRKV